MYKSFYYCFALIIFVACESKKESVPDFKEGNFEKGEKKIEEKKVKGDTIAMPFESLQKYLPKSIAGYISTGDPKGKTVNENGMSWSVAEKNYLSNGKKLKITLADYNGAYGLYVGAIAVFDLEKIESDDEQAQVINLKNGNLKGWESYIKPSRSATLILCISDRYLLTIESEDQDNTELVKQIGESFDLKALLENGNKI